MIALGPLFLTLIISSSWGVEAYQSTENSGESKYYRINNIENYLEKFTSEFNQLKDRLQALEDSIAANKIQSEQKDTELERQLTQMQALLANLVEKNDWEDLKKGVNILQNDFSALVKRIQKNGPIPSLTPAPSPTN